MIKKVDISESKSITVNTGLGWMLTYKQTFGEDILPKVLPAIEAMLDLATTASGEMPDHDTLDQAMVDLSLFEATTIFEVVWAMCKSAGSITGEPIPEFNEWMNGIDEFPLDILIPELLGDVVKSFVSSKNRDRLQKTVETLTAATL